MTELSHGCQVQHQRLKVLTPMVGQDKSLLVYVIDLLQELEEEVEGTCNSFNGREKSPFLAMSAMGFLLNLNNGSTE